MIFMSQFDYEKTIWGKGTAKLSWCSPTFFRLWRSINWLKSLPDGSRILEVGSGAGQFIRAFKKYNPTWQCYGADISISAIEDARVNNDGVEYALISDGKLPYQVNSFDAVLIFDVLEHVDNPTQFLEDVSRVLKPDGKFYGFVPCEGDKLSFWNCLRKKDFWRDLTLKHAGHVQHLSRQQWLNIFTEAGFVTKKINYSEHFLGQIWGVLSFYLMERKSRTSGGRQINNELFFSQPSYQTNVFTFLRKTVNFFINLESFVFRFLPSPNMHVLLEKKYER